MMSAIPQIQRTLNHRARRRRGASYVFFLGTALLVATIGLTALAVMRVKLRAAAVDNDSAIARFNARTAVEIAMLTIASDSNWRDTIVHGDWETSEQIGDGSFTYKIVDEKNGNLTTDKNSQVRIYGKGESGDALWIYSVLVQPPPDSLFPDIIDNGDFETGAEVPWTLMGGSTLSISGDAAIVHSGAWGMQVKTRPTPDAGLGQLLSSSLEKGATYYADFWIKMKDTPDVVSVIVNLTSDGGPESLDVVQAQADTSWTHIAGTFTPTWTGTLFTSSFTIKTTLTTSEFMLDDVSMRKLTTDIGPLAGTWQREAN
jgi:hypothetical protein